MICCEYCDKKIPDIIYKQHIIDTHDKKLDHTCSKCGKFFLLLQEVNNHTHIEIEKKENPKQVSENKKQILCLHCDKTYERDEWSSHLDIKSLLNISYCDYCEKQYVNSEEFCQHFLDAHEKNIKCSLQEDHRIKGNKIICSYCGNLYHFVRFKTHMNIFHKKINEHTCGICNKFFIEIHELSSHRKNHNDNLINCEYCNNEYDLVRFKTHIRFFHHKLDSHTCAICNKFFVQSSELTSHKKTHQISAELNYTPKPAEDATRGIGRCSRCFADFEKYIQHKCVNKYRGKRGVRGIRPSRLSRSVHKFLPN